MKKMFLSLIGAASFLISSAQTKAPIEWGAGVNLAIPVGNFSKGYSFGFGFEGNGEYRFSEQGSGIASIGYTHFLGKKVDGYYYDYKNKGVGAIPILVGGRFYPNEQFFVGGKLGISIFTNEGGGTGFTFAPQAGYDAGQFQALLSFNLLTQNGGNASYFGLSGIYKFAAKK